MRVPNSASGLDGGTSARLLLVEFAATDRFHRGVLLPYLFGFAKRAGVPARWLRFGISAATRFLRNETGVGLDTEDCAHLSQVLRELRPTRIVLNMRPSASLLAVLRQCAAAAEVALVGETYAGDANDEGEAPLADFGTGPAEWSRRLGVADSALVSARPFTDVRPHFGYEAANEAAAHMQPLPFVFLGPECTYNRSFRSSPVFAELDLSGCVRQGGCAFCSRPPGNGQEASFSIEAARDQLEAVATTVPKHDGRLAIRLVGEPALRHVDELAALCREIELGPADLLLDSRADELVRRRAALAAAAGLLRGSDIRLHIALVGVENFSRPELERMNKGLTPCDNLDAALTLLEMERDYPDTFNFREHGGLSLILFTPWTTLEDLAVNLRIIQACGLEAMCGKALTGRLRLEPDLPMTVLARRDGLLTAAYDDPTFDTAARNLYGPEMPWRFRDSRVKPICQITVRLANWHEFEGDALAEQVARLLEKAHNQNLGTLDLAVDLVEEALLDGPLPSVEAIVSPTAVQDEGLTATELVAGLEARLQRVEPRRYRTEESLHRAPSVGWHGDNADIALLVALSHAAIKPVSKVELVAENESDALIEWFTLPNARTYKPAGAGERVEIFFGARLEDVDRMIPLAARAGAMQHQHEEGETQAEIGRLLGYPECCVQAFAVRETAQARDSWAWLRLARRMAVPGPVWPSMNPWTGFLTNHYIACSLDCPASLELALRVRDVARSMMGAAAVEAIECQMANPWLSILRGQGSALELVPDDPPGERFRFIPGNVKGSAPELARAAEANEIILEPDRLLLLRHGRLLQDLTARAYVWWHERALQVEFWQRMLALRAFRDTAPPTVRGKPMDAFATGERTIGDLCQRAPQPGERRATTELRPETALLRRALQAALSEVAGRGCAGRFQNWNLDVRDDHTLVLRLGTDEDEVALYVSDARRNLPCLFRAGPFAFAFPRDMPLDTPGRRAKVRDLARHLRAWLSVPRSPEP